MDTNMRKILFFFIILFVTTGFGPVYCDDTQDLILTQLNNADLQDIQQFVDAINKEADGYLPKLNIKEMLLGLFKGNAVTNAKGIINGLVAYMFRETVQNFSLLARILILAVFCAMLQNLHSAFESDTIGKLAYNICYMLIIILAINSFKDAVIIGTDAIDSMVAFMQSLLPTLLTLLMSVGGIASSTVFQPIIFTSITVISTFIKTIIIPIILFSAVLAILNNLSESIQISKLAALLKQFAVGLLGLVLTVFLGIISVQGVAASSLDGVSIQTAKFAVDNFIPIIGGFLKDALDAVVSCSMLIKNGIGIAGLLILLLICIIPLIKMLSIVLIYKISSALIQPILNNQIVNCLNDMGNSMLVIMISVIAVGVMFFMAITVIIGIGNMAVMMR